MNPLQDAFISYGRADSKQFAKGLNDRLAALGYTIWFDFDDIPLGVDYQKQIDDGIDKADNVLFIISPHSVNSPYCKLEIELALKRNKRIIPLLHVEQISRETWQDRNPGGTDANWDASQAAGKHTCFKNMHPAIAKINWVYFREGQDDYEQSLQGLLELLNRQKDYVHQHTVLLNQALDWERNQKQTPYLLIGEERQQAEAWLAQRFQDEQAPCIPTDLHCEYITESIKNANNLMTQVFLCHAEQDREVADKVRRSLMRNGITTWIHHGDIELGSDFQAAMARGVEAADNVIFLMSPEAFQSSYCQQELDRALALNKRIIPLQTRPVEPSQIPEALQTLQYIDLTDNQNEADYQQDESDLLRLLNRDAAYYNEHKVLLTKALKWERDNQNPCILLRGYELQHAETWLKLSAKHPQYGPTALQKAFITESQRQPSDINLDVFVSYSRADSDFARKLNDRLQRQEKRTWFDQESIASGTDFQQEIYKGIEASDHFLFIISPSSVNSPYCADEVEYAASLNKRIVTVRHRAAEELHPELAKLQWIDFLNVDFEASFQELLRTLEKDPAHLQAHTRLLNQAIAWEKSGQRQGRLLRGEDLGEAEQWLLKGAGKQPSPTSLQGEYVAASRALIEANRKATVKQQRLVIGGLVSLLVLAVAGLAAAVVQSREANAQTRLALGRQLAAQASLLHQRSDRLPQTLLLAAEATQRLQSSGVSAAEVNPLLRNGYLLTAEQARINHEDLVWDVVFSPDGQTVATASGDGTARLWDIANNQEIARINHEDSVRHVVFSPDGQTAATASWDGTARVWDIANNQEIARIKHENRVNEVVFSPDGQTVATASNDGTSRLWDVATNQEVGRINHESSVRGIAFSPDGQIVATASGNIAAWSSTTRLWDVATKQESGRINHEEFVLKIVFSPDSQTVATAGWDGTARLWDVATKQESGRINHEDWVFSVVFSPDSQTLATASRDGTARLWDIATNREIARINHEAQVMHAVFSPDGQTVATSSNDGTALLWDIATNQEVGRIDHQDRVWEVAFSPDSRKLATASSDGTARLWDIATNQEIAQINHEDAVHSAVFSPDGQTIATSSNDGTARLWDIAQNQEIAQINHEDSVYSAVFGSGGQTLATASSDGTARLWDIAQNQETAQINHEDSVDRAVFGSGGRTVATVSGDIVRVWDITTNQEIARVNHEESVLSVAFSPDGRIVATASADRTVKLWDIATNQEVGRINHEDVVWNVVFSPDGQTVATVSDDGMVVIEPVATDVLIQATCRRLTRNLTVQEWEQYIGVEVPYHRTCENLPYPSDHQWAPPTAILSQFSQLTNPRTFFEQILSRSPS